MGKTGERDCGTAVRRKPEKELPAVWTVYGKLVRLFRERAGLTQQTLAEAIGYSVEQVASVEQGRRPAKATFTQAAERVLRAEGALQVLQEDVDRAKLPEFFQDFALLEAEAVSRFSYDPMLVPGLLQTESYARALLEAHRPPLEDDAIDQHVTARLDRQVLLHRREEIAPDERGAPAVGRLGLLHAVSIGQRVESPTPSTARPRADGPHRIAVTADQEGQRCRVRTPGRHGSWS
jgi:transcriptional regulator with XRE-family HTH domain